MDFKFFRNRIKVSLYSIGIFAFFLLISLVSLYIVREKYWIIRILWDSSWQPALPQGKQDA